MATRVSMHNGRAGKKGAYSAKHNDRAFDTSMTEHIDPALTPNNINERYGGDFGAKTNEEHELKFYEKHFRKSLDRKNAGYKAKGKAKQIKTMDQYYRSRRSCPEETLYTIGKDANPDLLWRVYQEHRAWKEEKFPQVVTLSASLHVDEPDAMHHIHERTVWVAHDKTGLEVVGQAKALAEMGIHEPDPFEDYGPKNNAKMTYTKLCRNHFVATCKAHGLEVIEEPLPSDKVGLDLMEYKIQHAQERAEEAQAEVKTLLQKTEALSGRIEHLQKESGQWQEMIEEHKQDEAGALEQAYKANITLQETRTSLSEARNELKGINDHTKALKANLGVLERQTAEAKAELDLVSRAIDKKIAGATKQFGQSSIQSLISQAKEQATADKRKKTVERFLELPQVKPLWEKFQKTVDREHGREMSKFVDKS